MNVSTHASVLIPLTFSSDHADHFTGHPHYGSPGEFYRAIIDLSSTTLTLDDKTYKVYAGGMYPRADCRPDAAVEEIVKRYGPRFESHGELLSSGLMRYWKRNFVLGSTDGWVYVKREEGAVELPKSFWLLKVKEGEQERDLGVVTAESCARGVEDGH
jgi:hypothetical protein